MRIVSWNMRGKAFPSTNMALFLNAVGADACVMQEVTASLKLHDISTAAVTTRSRAPLPQLSSNPTLDRRWTSQYFTGSAAGGGRDSYLTGTRSGFHCRYHLMQADPRDEFTIEPGYARQFLIVKFTPSNSSQGVTVATAHLPFMDGSDLSGRQYMAAWLPALSRGFDRNEVEVLTAPALAAPAPVPAAAAPPAFPGFSPASAGALPAAAGLPAPAAATIMYPPKTSKKFAAGKPALKSVQLIMGDLNVKASVGLGLRRSAEWNVALDVETSTGGYSYDKAIMRVNAFNKFKAGRINLPGWIGGQDSNEIILPNYECFQFLRLSDHCPIYFDTDELKYPILKDVEESKFGDSGTHKNKSLDEGYAKQYNKRARLPEKK